MMKIEEKFEELYSLVKGYNAPDEIITLLVCKKLGYHQLTLIETCQRDYYECERCFITASFEGHQKKINWEPLEKELMKKLLGDKID